jgi:hypothetical protein
MSTIGRIYCLNDACFHIFIALAILFLTRRYDLAAVVLAAPVLITGIAYFYVNNEIFLSGSILILYMAVYNGVKDSILKISILFPCLFFIIWSNPVSMIVLIVFLAGVYTSTAQISKDKWILVFIMINIFIRMLYLDNYDRSNINQLKGELNGSSLIDFALEYCQTYWYMILLAIGGIYYTESKKRMKYVGLLSMPILAYFCIVRRLNGYDEHFAKFLYPPHLFILMQAIVLMAEKGNNYKKVLLTLICMIWASALYYTLSNYHPVFMKRVVLAETLNAICRSEDPRQAKWYVKDAPLLSIASSDLNMECVFLCMYERRSVQIQILAMSQIREVMLDTVPEDRYYICDGMPPIHLSDFNPYYFHPISGPYKELVLDSAKLSMIRKACR